MLDMVDALVPGAVDEPGVLNVLGLLELLGLLRPDEPLDGLEPR